MFSFPKKGNKTESFVSKGLARLSADAIRALSPAKAITSYSRKWKWKWETPGLEPACLIHLPGRTRGRDNLLSFTLFSSCSISNTPSSLLSVSSCFSHPFQVLLTKGSATAFHGSPHCQKTSQFETISHRSLQFPFCSSWIHSDLSPL